jgi:hypothetical protein
MRNQSASIPARILLSGCLACLLFVPCYSQKAAPPRASLSEGAGLLTRIKAVDSPVFRAYLYSRAAAWLAQDAGEDASVRRLSLEAAATGIADLQQHEREVPEAPAALLYSRMLAVVSKQDPQRAEELKRAYPLRREVEQTNGDKITASFYSALAKLDNPAMAAQGADLAARLITSGVVRPSVLLGELMRLDQSKSLALPQLLAATLTLAEARPGMLPLQTMFFLSNIYLNASTPGPLQARFLAAALRDTRLGPDELKSPAATWATPLLQKSLPFMQRLTPDLYAEASARLASLAPGARDEGAVYDRVRDSSDPLGQLMTEADSETDARVKGELLESAARKARQEGKLRLAVELLASAEASRRVPESDDARRDEFLSGVVTEALAQKDFETAGFAASHVRSQFEGAAALQQIARRHAKADDLQSALKTLAEAEKLLERAPDGKERADAYFRLVADYAPLDGVRATSALREGIKAANNLSRPRAVPEGEFSWKLLPLTDRMIRTFQTLARTDRAGALSLANTLQPKELAVAATLGVYSSTPEAGGQP